MPPFATAIADRLPSSAETVDRLRAAAWAELGLVPADLARLAIEDTRMRPNRSSIHSKRRRPLQRASDVLDVRERARVMAAIAAAYARLHASAPAQFLWAGFAAIAVNDGVRPTVDLALGAAAVAARAPAWGALGRIARDFEDAIKCAFETNLAIYDDLAWVHLAFREGGAALVAELDRDGELDADVHAAFAAIAGGRVERGNLMLFRREQDRVVTPIFERYAAAMARATALGLICVPNGHLAARCAATGRAPAWRGTASYGPFAARWRWLVEHAWQPFVDLRDAPVVTAAIARARAGEPERPVLARTAIVTRRLLRAALS